MDVSSRYARYAAHAFASPQRYTRRAWGFSAVGIPEKKRSTLRARVRAGQYKLRSGSEISNVQHREERGDDRAVLCRFRATGKRTVRAWGNGERPNAPPAQNSRGRDHVSISIATVQRSTEKRTRQSREDGATISTSRPIFIFIFILSE
jgi:hypothetical protein